VKNTKYYLAAIVAFLIWGFFSLVLKPLHAYASLDILFYRVFLCSVLLLLITFGFKRKQLQENIKLFKELPVKRKRRTILINMAGGILLTVNWFSFIYVMNHVTVKAASLAYLVCPILTTLLAHFILHEKLKGLQWVSMGLSIVGCLLLSYTNLIDMVFSLIVGLSYALYLITQRQNKGFDKIIVLTFQIVLSGVLLLPFYPVYSMGVPTAFDFYFYIAIIAIGFTIIPLFLNLYALKGINSSTIGMLLNINPIIGFLLAAYVYHEQMNLIQIIAYSIIFIAVVAFNAQLFLKKES